MTETEPRSVIMADVSRQLTMQPLHEAPSNPITLRTIHQSVGGLIQVVLPLQLDEGAHIDSYWSERDGDTITLCVRLQIADVKSASLAEAQGEIAQRVEIERLRAALEECSNDLAAYIKHHYDRTLDYASQRAKYDAEMNAVRNARKLLGQEVLADRSHGPD